MREARRRAGTPRDATTPGKQQGAEAPDSRGLDWSAILKVSSLFFVALFIERVLEVFLTSWRAESATKLKLKAEAASKQRNGADPPTEDEERAGEYKDRTRRIAFFAGTAIGVTVAALGIRLRELFVDPVIFESLPTVQRKLFRTADVLLTGAVLGGGSDALHQLVSVFTNFMESAARRAGGG